ncbi:MAG: protease modulator HflK [Planctomycetia bacterium]|nr:protease modulator HflK [Planctomycetia bacterium]
MAKNDGAWRGLVWATAATAIVTGLVTIIYGTKIYGAGSLLMTVLGISLGMVATSAFLVLHARRLREKLAEIAQWKRPEWGEDVENPYRIEFDQGKILHFLVLGLIPTAIFAALTVYLMIYWTKSGEVWLVPKNHAILAAILSMVGCIVWLMLARSYDAIVENQEESELPEAKALAEASWEACWWMGLVSVVLLVKPIWPVCEPILYWAMMWWILAVALEQGVRLFLGWMQTQSTQETFVTPVTVFLRYMVFVRGNPINSLFYTMEKRWGVSFRSSWAIRFVARATVPAILLVLLLSWGLSSLYVVRVNELGVRKDFGKIHFTPLEPGLHFKWPWPFGEIATYPVKQVSMMPIGFVQSGSGQLSFLWSKAHEQEYELVLGDGTEAVSIHAMVHYKIREDSDGFFQHVLQFQNPEDAIRDYAHRCMTELTRCSTLEQVLATQRDEFSADLRTRLQNYINENQLGVEIVEVAMLNFHPPVSVAESYLDVISAGIDAKRVQIVAEGTRAAAIFEAQQQSEQIVAEAKVTAANYVATAGAETAEFLAAGKSFAINPECFQLRYWLDSIQELLRNKRLALVDESVDVFFDMQKQGSSEVNRNMLMRAE